ncbi:hypothetical protein VIGAN_11077500, partial [Vigna angularis var. angularis]
LYFLKSREVVATSVLSKRWNLLWRSVSSLDFDTKEYFSLLKCENDIHTFYSSVCSFLINPSIDFVSDVTFLCIFLKVSGLGFKMH